MENQNINFKEFDSFIQKCLDKYFYVEPWKKLYERTGKFHNDIISDKPTIPDLIIYNKYFNKSFCFYESNQNSYIRFPRMRFILRPKFKKEYNPISTYGKDNEILSFPKKEKPPINEDLNSFEIKEQKESILQLDKEDLIIERNEDNIKNKSDIDKEEEEDEEDPEWANDEVNDYFNKEVNYNNFHNNFPDDKNLKLMDKREKFYKKGWEQSFSEFKQEHPEARISRLRLKIPDALASKQLNNNKAEKHENKNDVGNKLGK